MRYLLAAASAMGLIGVGCAEKPVPTPPVASKPAATSTIPQQPRPAEEPAPIAADFAIHKVRVFDGANVVPQATVLVAAGEITAVGADVEIPAGAEAVDGGGRTLLPGLIDCHTHTFSAAQLETAAAFGVTTELDMAGDPGFAGQIRSQRDSAEAAERADLLSAGTPVTAPGGHPTQIPWFNQIETLNSPNHAADFVASRIAEGSDYIKIIYDDGRVYGLEFPTISAEMLEKTVEAAHRHDKLAVAHVAALEDARTALSAGVDGLVHIFADQPIDDELIELARAQDVFVVPTLSVLESAAGVASGLSLVDKSYFQSHLAADELDNLKASFPRQPGSKVDFPIASQAVERLHAAGVRILAGTDAPNPGTAHGASIHRELELLVDAGLSPVEALASATSFAAESFGLSTRGRIAPGLRADLVLVEGDPTTDVHSTRRIVKVWKGGELVDLESHENKVEAAKQLASTGSDSPQLNLVSDFEAEEVAGNWLPSTDQLVGGKSTAEFERVQGGADGSQGSLLISGVVADRPDPRWAGATYSPGPRPMAPVDLSDKKSIRFAAKGDGKSCFVMLFFQKRGFQPSTKTFVAGEEWHEHRFQIDQFDGCDGSDIMAVFFGGGTEPGAFRLQIDDVRFE